MPLPPRLTCRLLLPWLAGSALLAAADPGLPPGLSPLPAASDGSARATLTAGSAGYPLRRTVMPGGWTAWLGEVPVDGVFAAAAIGGPEVADASPAQLDHAGQDSVLRALAIRFPDLQIHRTRWEWRGLIHAAVSEFTDTHTSDLADPARRERFGAGWLLAGPPPAPGEEVIVDGDVAARTGPALANGLRLWVADCAAPAPTGAEARARAGFRLVPTAAAEPSAPGASPDGRFHAEIVRAGMERASLWIHDGRSGDLLHHLRVPGMRSSWDDATTIRVDGDGGTMRIDAASGRVLGVVAAPSVADQPDGIIGHDSERVYGGGPLAAVRDARLLPGGRHALVYSPDFGSGLLELGTGRLLWTRQTDVAVAGNGTGFALAVSPDGRWFLDRHRDQAALIVRQVRDGAEVAYLWPGDCGVAPQRVFTFAADGASLEITAADGTSGRWSIPDGRHLGNKPAPATPTAPPALRGEWPEVSCDDADDGIAVDGMLVASCPDGLLRVWRDTDRSLVRVLGCAPIGAVTGIRPLPGGVLVTHHARGWATWQLDRGLLAWVDEGWQQPEDANDLGILSFASMGALLVRGDAAERWAVDAGRSVIYTPGSGSPWELLARRLPSLEPLWSWSATAAGAPIAMLPSGAWFAERDAAWGLAVALGAERVPLASFDLALNRPEAVLSVLGLASADEVAAWRALTERRLKRSHTMPVLPTGLAGLPRVRLEAPAQADGSAHIAVQVGAERDLRRLLIEVDGVPWPGISGLPIPAGTAWSGSIAVPLAAGANRIEVSAEDANGREGVRAIATVTSTAAAGEAVLHVLAIGVGEYPLADPRWRLAYPAKDARDLVAALQRTSNRSVDALVLTDAEASAAGIVAAHARLLAGRPGDAVVVFLAGHGALDAQGEYRFFASDCDPGRPESGVPWSAIEGLLDGIPARDRLVLIDTCASGDDDGPPAVAALPGVRSRGLRSTGQAAVARLPVSAVFLDAKRGAGAQVVAASGADEWSFESGELANGLFTAAILRGLAPGLPADANQDYRITAGELAAWTVAEVGRLSGGAQRPRMRAANPGRGVAIVVPAPSPVADDAGERRSRDAWTAYESTLIKAYVAAALLDRDPQTARDAVAQAWRDLQRLAATEAPGVIDDQVRALVGERLSGAAWPIDVIDHSGTPQVPKPAWATDHGADRFGTWADAVLDGVRFRFRWCPGGATPSIGWKGRRIALPPAPGAWVAASHLTMGQAKILGLTAQEPDNPWAATTCTAREARQMIAALGARLHVTVGTPGLSLWARVWASGAAMAPASIHGFSPMYATTLDTSVCAIWPSSTWGICDIARPEEWIDGGSGPATTQTISSSDSDYPDLLLSADRLERALAYERLPLRPVIRVP
jgi:uncharacterized caspase-like protein